LESWIPVAKARELVNGFFDDRITYPDYDFYSRKRGINKDIPEEFYPLLLFAESIPSATSLRLSSDSLSGPDGVVLCEDGSEITVQITMSHERDNGYKIRQSLRDTGTWIGKGRDTNETIAERLGRILEAIKDKETKFRAGTEVLLVVDESISWGDVIDPSLPNALRDAVALLPASKYSATYVIFGTNVRQMMR
jgi:hypothetical protein